MMSLAAAEPAVRAVKTMVASEQINCSDFARRMRELGFHVTTSIITEKNLEGEDRRSRLVKIVSHDMKKIIYLRMGEKSRLKLIVYTEGEFMEDLCDQLEDLGYEVVQEEDRITAHMSVDDLVTAFNKIIETVNILKLYE